MESRLVVSESGRLEQLTAKWRSSGARIGFVPTMGALHRGHLSLIERARESADRVVCSIFVNPTQFNEPDDLKAYPREAASDCRKLEAAGVDAVYLPDESEIYPEGFQTVIAPGDLASRWEGEGRPGHFEGVATVVSILFQLVRPDLAVFGEKDFQQLRVVQQMVRDLRLPVEIVPSPLVRDVDGLALSSRNALLDAPSREQALSLSRGLFCALELFREGERSASTLERAVREQIGGSAAVRYCAVVDEEALLPVKGEVCKPSRILLAAEVSGVRLLDNMPLVTER